MIEDFVRALQLIERDVAFVCAIGMTIVTVLAEDRLDVLAEIGNGGLLSSEPMARHARAKDRRQDR